MLISVAVSYCFNVRLLRDTIRVYWDIRGLKSSFHLVGILDITFA